MRTAIAAEAHRTARAGAIRRRVAGDAVLPSMSSRAAAAATDAVTTRLPRNSPVSAPATAPTASQALRGMSADDDERTDLLERLLAEHAPRAQLVHAAERLFLARRDDLCGSGRADSRQLFELG